MYFSNSDSLLQNLNPSVEFDEISSKLKSSVGIFVTPFRIRIILGFTLYRTVEITM